MKTSPFTGGPVTREHKQVTFTYRGEEYTVNRCYYRCVDTGRTFSDAELDDEVMADLLAQYQKRHPSE